MKFCLNTELLKITVVVFVDLCWAVRLCTCLGVSWIISAPNQIYQRESCAISKAIFYFIPSSKSTVRCVIWVYTVLVKNCCCQFHFYVVLAGNTSSIRLNWLFDVWFQRFASWLLLSVLQVYTRWHTRKAKHMQNWATWLGIWGVCLFHARCLFFLSNICAGWSALLPAQIRDFLLTQLRTHYTLPKSKTQDRNMRKMVRNQSQARAGKKPNQRGTECILTDPAFSLGEESAILLPGTGTEVSTQRTSTKSNQANDEVKNVVECC